MKTLFATLTLLAALCAIGCKDVDEIPGPPGQAGGPPGNVPGRDGMVNNNSTVHPVLPGAGAGGMTPVTGTESLDGTSGGGVGQSAKDMARRTAAGAGNPSGMTPAEPGDNGNGSSDEGSTG